jgi:hypothetical protein
VTEQPADQIEIHDRRRRPYFMVRKEGLRAIRTQASGTRQARALGLYVLLCQMGNEQRQGGVRHQVRATYTDLTARGTFSRKHLRQLLDLLDAAKVATMSLQVGMRGSMPSLIEIAELSGRYVEITVDTGNHLARLDGVDLLPSLALLATLLELCDDQGGDRAEATRAELAETQLGCSVRTLDGWVKGLEAAGVLHVVRRPYERGGGYRPNLWEVIEPAQALADALIGPSKPLLIPGGADISVEAQPQNRLASSSEPARRSEGTGQAQPGAQPNVVAGTGQAQDGDGPCADSPTRGFETAPHAGAGNDGEEQQKTSSPPSPSSPPSGSAPVGGDRGLIDQERLCEALLTTLQPRLGDGPRRIFERDHRRWLAAAGKVLERYPAEQLQPAMRYMLTDRILGSKGVTMPGFERIVDELLFRAGTTADNAHHDDGQAIPWSAARRRLERAITQYGADRYTEALAELQAEHELYGRFIAQVRWQQLCSQPLHFPQFEQAWKTLAQTPGSAERAA